MKKYIYFFLFLASSQLFAQTFNLVRINQTGFPWVKAEFYIYDANGDYVSLFSPLEFEITEDGIPRDITSVSCPPPKPPEPISSVLTIDISGSMKWNNPTNLSIARAAALAWISEMGLGKSECAITSFNSRNYMNQDFTTDKDKLQDAIYALNPVGGTDYNHGLMEQMSGGILAASRGKHKRAVIFLTDGMPTTRTNVEEIIKLAKAENTAIYAVTLNMACPQVLKTISEETGGLWFENITTADEAKAAYKNILNIVQNVEPCSIEWLTSVVCNQTKQALKIKNIKYDITAERTYNVEEKFQSNIIVEPAFVNFNNVMPGMVVDTTITLTAQGGTFSVGNIVTNNPLFDITPKSFELEFGKSIELQVTFAPFNTNYTWGQFEVENSLCEIFINVSAFAGSRSSEKTLKITHPNGGEKFVIGSDTVITWEGISIIDTVQIEYSIDKGQTWETVVEKASGGKHIWENIPNTESDECIMRLRQYTIMPMPSQADKAFLLNQLQGHTQQTNYAAWDRTGTRVATVSNDNTIKVWNTMNGDMIGNFTGHFGAINHIGWSPDYTYLATASDDSRIRIWDAASGATWQTLVGHTGPVKKVYWNNENMQVLSISTDNTARLWEAVAGFERITFEEHTDAINHGQWSPNAIFVATASADSTVKIWNTTIGEVLQTLIHPSEVNYVSWHPDGKLLATASNDNSIRIWNTTNGTLDTTFANGDTSYIKVEFSTDGTKLLALDSDSRINVWNKKNWSLIHTFTGHQEEITDVKWHPDGEFIASSSKDDTTRIWDIKNGGAKYILNSHSNDVLSVNWSPEGSRLITTSKDNQSHIWYINEPVITQEDVSDSLWAIVIPKYTVTSVDMGMSVVNVPKDSLVVTFIRNTADYPVNIRSFEFYGSTPNAFSVVSGEPPFTIPGRGFKPVEFRFTPERIGVNHSNIRVITALDTTEVTIRGDGMPPNIQLVNDLVDFGKVLVGETFDTLQVATIKNVSNKPITITQAKHNLPNIKDFTTISDLSSFILEPDEEALFDLRFKPSDVGRTSGTLEFYFNDVGSPAIVSLFGEGISRHPQIQAGTIPNFELICNDSISHTLNISNIGAEELIIDNIIISGGNPLEFLIEQELPLLIASEDEVDIEITFKPTSIGNKKGTLTINSNSQYDETIEIELIGTKQEAKYSLDKNIIELGSLELEELAYSEILISNIGSVPLTIDLFESSLLNVTQNRVTLQPGSAPFPINITFKGSDEAMNIQESIRLIDNVCGIEVIVPITGIVSIEEIAMIQADPISFPELRCTSTAIETLTISNLGNAVLEISDISISGINASSFSYNAELPIIIEPQEEYPLEIILASKSVGDLNANLEISSNSAVNSTLILPLSARQERIDISITDGQTIEFVPFCPGETFSFLLGFENFSTTETIVQVIPSGKFTITGGNEILVPPNEMFVFEINYHESEPENYYIFRETVRIITECGQEYR